jgi:Resolvase, N terminal domain
MSGTKRAALYVRVSTDAQTVENQIRELRQVAKRRGWDVAEVYSDAGISGAKGRNGRPGLDSTGGGVAFASTPRGEGGAVPEIQNQMSGRK